MAPSGAHQQIPPKRPTTGTDHEDDPAPPPWEQLRAASLWENAFAKRTADLDKAVWNQFRAARRIEKTNRGAVNRLWAAWAPSVAKTIRYGASLRKLLLYAWPLGRVSVEEFFLHQRLAQRMGARLPVHRAVAAKPRHMVKILRSRLPLLFRVLFLFLWLSLSRFADLSAAVFRQRKGLIQTNVPTHKGDPLGKRPLVKFTPAVGPLTADLVRKAARIITYARALAALKRILPRLSLHSFRRGGVTTLSGSHPLVDIARLSGHSSTQARDERGIRAYAVPRPSSHEARHQLLLAHSLWSLVAEKL